MSGTTRVSRYQKGKTRKVKTNLYLLEQEIVSASGICWAICNAYSLRPPAGDTWVHLIPHSTHPESSSLHSAVKAGSLSEIEKKALPPTKFRWHNFGTTAKQVAMVWALAAKRRQSLGKKCIRYEVEGARPRGRSKRTWRQVVQKDCQAHKLNTEGAVDCSRWRKLIKDGWWSG